MFYKCDRHFTPSTSDRPLIPQPNDRNSPQIKQRSPPVIALSSHNPTIATQIKQRSPISSDTLNAQSDRPLISKTNDRNSSQIKSNNDRLFPQTHQMFKAIAISFHKPTIATHLKSSNDRIIWICTLNIDGKLK
ncbi:hypothetical protein [Pseudanabaena sp. ABRG5-3]|uniref:hypothetical protein n=1 Tax=Pseudanabaena sp. ABRG5-3 TaxID=685565 RepID=UPI000F817350|nr:hypothetical protein [Pseudanabaena sp. ABRG5-3]